MILLSQLLAHTLFFLIPKRNEILNIVNSQTKVIVNTAFEASSFDSTFLHKLVGLITTYGSHEKLFFKKIIRNGGDSYVVSLRHIPQLT